MRHLPSAAALVALSLAVVTVPAAPPAADPTAARVAALIGQLGSPDFHAREAASRQLAAVGEPALDAAKAAAASEDMEVARRAADVAERIAADIDTARTLAPTLVELSAEHEPLIEVLADLRKQTGYKVGVVGPSTGAIPVAVKTDGKVPFWEAVDRLCAAAKVHVVADPAQLRPGVTFPGEPTVPAAPLFPAEGFEKELADLQRQRADALGRVRAATEARVKATTDEEKARATAGTAAAQAEMMKVLRRIVDVQAQARQRAAAGPSVAGPAPVVLRPLTDATAPVSLHGVVRVEVVPFPAAALGSLPAGTVPVLLHVAPEPKLRLERVESVRVTRAVDDAGRDLRALPSDDAAVGPAVPHAVAVKGANVVVGPNGRLDFVPDVSGKPLAFSPLTSSQAVVRLKAGDSPSKSLKHLDGVIRAVVRTGPQELAAVAGVDPQRGGAASANGVGLSVSPVLPTQTDGEFSFDVTVGYHPGAVRAEGGVADSATDSAVVVQGGGQVIIRRQFRGRVVVNGRVMDTQAGTGSAGINVVGADGKLLAATVTHRERRLSPSGAVADVLKMTVKGAPAKVAFTGTRAKTVEVPFRLTDVALAAGDHAAPSEAAKP